MSQNTSTNTHGDAIWHKITAFLYRGVVKNAIDSTCALLALIVLSPLLILIAVRIKQDSPGPVLIKQKCEGLKGHSFKMRKFRTHQLVVTGSAENPKHMLRETYIGKVLKDANLESLPQLFNVFIGDMSLVGPRPQLLDQTMDMLKIVPNYKNRTLVKPGMTGWAQINGLRGPLSTIADIKQRFRYDVDYTKYASFKTDCYILFKTLPLLKSA